MAWNFILSDIWVFWTYLSLLPRLWITSVSWSNLRRLISSQVCLHFWKYADFLRLWDVQKSILTWRILEDGSAAVLCVRRPANGRYLQRHLRNRHGRRNIWFGSRSSESSSQPQSPKLSSATSNSTLQRRTFQLRQSGLSWVVHRTNWHDM